MVVHVQTRVIVKTIIDYHQLSLPFERGFKFGNFTWSFGRLRQRIVLKCVPHVQHDYFSLFNQSDHCFPASSLPSSLLKLPIRELFNHSIQYTLSLTLSFLEPKFLSFLLVDISPSFGENLYANCHSCVTGSSI